MHRWRMLTVGVLSLCMIAEPLGAAPQTSDDLQRQIDQLKKEIELLNQEKSKVDAEAALAKAQSAATLAKYFGEVKAGPYSGSVNQQGGYTGTEEAALLTASAIREGAAQVAAKVAAKVAAIVETNSQGQATSQSKTVYIFSKDMPPRFQQLIAFRAREKLVMQGFNEAGIPTPIVGFFEKYLSPDLYAGALEGISSVLDYFRTDYTLGSTAPQVDESVLLFSVAGRLVETGSKVKLPAVFNPWEQIAAADVLSKDLTTLLDMREAAESKVGELLAPKKDNSAGQLDDRVAKLKTAITRYDTFMTWLGTPDSQGNLPLAMVAQELALKTAVEKSMVLLLRLENTGGGYLVKKNMWTGLGVMPLYHMGGATVTYLLLDGETGVVSTGGVIPIFGGYVKSSKMRSHLR